MKRRFRHTASVLNALPVLEAAGRHQSFTKAGQELGLSQPTVSHHIRGLEDLVEAPLFDRRHNRLTLTQSGQRLAAAAALGLGHIEDEIRRIQASARPGSLTLACSFAFANGWLMPRFSGLKRALGDIPINLMTVDWLNGFDRESADLLVVWTGEEASEHERIALFPEIVAPVCSPEFLSARPELNVTGMESPAWAARMLDQPLLHYDTRSSTFMTWESWFYRQGSSYSLPPEAYVYSNYEFMLQAVLEGEGIGLGWEHLVDGLLDSGRLKRVMPPIQGENTAYFLELRRGRVEDDVLELAAKWFQHVSAPPAD